MRSHTEIGKLPPQAPELEEAILGAILLERDAYEASTMLKPEYFYKDEHQCIYEAMMQLYSENKPIDILTVTEKLKANGKLDLAGGPYKLAVLSSKVSSSANVEYHSMLVLQKYNLRQIISVSALAIDQAYSDGADPFVIQSMISNELENNHAQLGSDPQPLKEIVVENINELAKMQESDSRVTGIDMGYMALNEVGHGWHEPDVIILAARPGQGKELINSSRVYNNTGFKTIGECVVGESVLGSDGNDYKITGVYPQGKKDVYRMTFSDFTYVDCGLEHQWSVSTRKMRKKKDNSSIVLTTKDMLDNVIIDDNRCNYRIKFCDPLKFNKQEISLDPYLLGAFIGDGYFGVNGIKFSNSEIDVIEKVSSLLPESDCLKYSQKYDYIVSRIKRNNTKSDLFKHIEKMGMYNANSHKKFIPKNYLYNTIEVRVALLQGLMDTDGYVDCNVGNRLEYSTTSEQLCNDIVELVRGLGGRATFSSKIGSYKKDGITHICKRYYRMCLSFPNSITPVSSKKHLSKYTYNQRRFSKYITSIEKLGYQEEMTCISVDAPDCLYITDGHTLTHNTASSLNFALKIAQQNIPIAFFSLEMSKKQLVYRLISIMTDIYSDRLKTADITESNWQTIHGANFSLPFHIDDTPSLSITELKIKARKLKKKQGIKMLFIDYLQLMTASVKGNREQEISTISRNIKALAKELNIPIMALAQLSRDVEKRSGPPRLSDLRESGSIEQDADIVIFLHNENDEDKTIKEPIIDFMWGKHRNGPNSKKQLQFNKRTQKFTDI